MPIDMETIWNTFIWQNMSFFNPIWLGNSRNVPHTMVSGQTYANLSCEEEWSLIHVQIWAGERDLFKTIWIKASPNFNRKAETLHLPS